MAGEKFKLNFITNGEGYKTIDEPIGFDSIPFVMKQNAKGYARDISFGGDNENEFTFQKRRNHELDTLIYYFETFGWESNIELIIEKDGVDNLIGNLDYKSAETDTLEYFKCKVINNN